MFRFVTTLTLTINFITRVFDYRWDANAAISRSISVNGYIIRMPFQFDSTVSQMVIFFHIFGQNTLISLCLDSPGCQNHQKNMWECFRMESLSDICSYYCGGGDFLATFLVYCQYFHYGNTVSHSESNKWLNLLLILC